MVFPVQPESESTRNLLRKAVVIGHKAQFVKPKSLRRKVAKIKLPSKFKNTEQKEDVWELGFTRYLVQ